MAPSAVRALSGLALASYVLSIVLANVLLAHGALVDFGFGLVAPSAVLLVGVTFTLRDLVQEGLGRQWAVAAIVAGACLSAVIAPAFAFVSATAFLVSELVDFAVYTPLRERSRVGAVLLSNTAGLLVDSCVFLMLAFGSLALIWGQVAGKALMTLAVIVPMTLWRGGRGVLAGNA